MYFILSLLVLNSPICKSQNYSNDAALEAIDNICGDSWCEGDFDFEFTDFRLSKIQKFAKVEFTLLFEESGLQKQYITKCVLQGFSYLNEILVKYPGYYGWQLSGSFYTALGDCIAEREEEFRLILGFD